MRSSRPCAAMPRDPSRLPDCHREAIEPGGPDGLVIAAFRASCYRAVTARGRGVAARGQTGPNTLFLLGPKGARNGNYKHGRYAAEAIATRRWVREKIFRLKCREVRAWSMRFLAAMRGHAARSIAATRLPSRSYRTGWSRRPCNRGLSCVLLPGGHREGPWGGCEGPNGAQYIIFAC